MIYRTKKSIISMLLVICFVFSTVLFCYADNYSYNGNNEKKDYSSFSGAKAEFYICLPNEKLNEISGEKYIFGPYNAGIYKNCDNTQMKLCQMISTESQGSKASEMIVTEIFKKDGKK